VGAVDGLFPGFERELNPLRVLFELLPLFTLAVSEAVELASKNFNGAVGVVRLYGVGV
jgi:hypothetical protein